MYIVYTIHVQIEQQAIRSKNYNALSLLTAENRQQIHFLYSI